MVTAWVAGRQQLSICVPCLARSPPFHGPHVLGVEQRLPLHQGEVWARASIVSPPDPGRPRLQAAEQWGAGGPGRREGPLDGLGGLGQGARGQVPKWGDAWVRQRLCLLCVPPPS